MGFSDTIEVINETSIMEHDQQSWLDGIPGRTAIGLGAALGIGAVGVIGFLVLLPSAIKGGSAPRTPPAATAPTPAPTPPAAPAAPRGPVNIVVSADDHVRGNPNAKVTIVEWSDFQCPFCSRFHPELVHALAEYGDKVRWVYRSFPLESIHPNARPAAEAAECASEQGKFWEFADKLFEKQTELGSDLYKKLAKDLGLKESQFNECVTSRKYQQKVRDQENAGLAVGVQGTPGSFVNGVEVPGAVPYDQLKGYIDAALKN